MSLQKEVYITASCTVYNNVVCKNGIPLFENKDIDVGSFLLAAYRHFEFQYPKFYKMDNLSKSGWLAAEILLNENFDNKKYNPEDTGIVLANKNSSLDTDLKYFETTKTIASPALFVYTLPNIVIGEISIRHNFKGENAFFILEEFDAAFLQQYVSNLFNNNILQRCICGWTEVLNETYKTVLFLAEKEDSGRSALFTKENLDKIYHFKNG